MPFLSMQVFCGCFVIKFNVVFAIVSVVKKSINFIGGIKKFNVITDDLIGLIFLLLQN